MLGRGPAAVVRGGANPVSPSDKTYLLGWSFSEFRFRQPINRPCGRAIVSGNRTAPITRSPAVLPRTTVTAPSPVVMLAWAPRYPHLAFLGLRTTTPKIRIRRDTSYWA